MSGEMNDVMSDAVSDAPILLHVEDSLARITLNRPSRLNAFDGDLARGWAEVTAEATSRSDVRAILLDAAGPAFCAGGDVVAMAQQAESGAWITELAEEINRGIQALVEAPIPVVAAAQGSTVGGGLGIMLCADYVVVDDRSKIGGLYSKIGLTPDLSVSAQLSAAVGERRALQLLLTERLLSAEEALSWGLVAEVVPSAELAQRALTIARGWVDGAAQAYGQAKRLIRTRPTRSFAEQLAEEARTIGAAFDTDEAQVRIRAFAEQSARKAR